MKACSLPGEAGASFLGLQLSPLLLQIAAQVEKEATMDFILWPVVDNRCMVGRTMAKRGRTEGSGFRVGRRGRHCLYLSASCNHLLVASDNDFRWRGPYKWHAQCFTDLKQGATITYVRVGYHNQILFCPFKLVGSISLIIEYDWQYILQCLRCSVL